PDRAAGRAGAHRGYRFRRCDARAAGIAGAGKADRIVRLRIETEAKGEPDATQRAYGENPRHQAREGMELEIYPRADRRLFVFPAGGSAVGSDEADKAAGCEGC